MAAALIVALVLLSTFVAANPNRLAPSLKQSSGPTKKEVVPAEPKPQWGSTLNNGNKIC